VLLSAKAAAKAHVFKTFIYQCENLQNVLKDKGTAAGAAQSSVIF